jgi:hypothetical protein
MNRLQQRKLTRQEPDSNPNARLLCDARACSLLTYRAIRAPLRERDISERDIGERDIGERDIVESDIRERDIGEMDIRKRDIRERAIGESVATCRFAEYLLLHIDIRSVSGCLSFLQSWHRWARILLLHTPQELLPTEGISLRSLWSWGRLQGLWRCGSRLRLWPWGMHAHLLALLKQDGWLVVYHGIYIVTQCIYPLSLANRPRFFAIILFLLLILIHHNLLLLIFLLFIFPILTVPFNIHIAVDVNAVRCVDIILHAHIHIKFWLIFAVRLGRVGIRI